MFTVAQILGGVRLDFAAHYGRLPISISPERLSWNTILYSVWQRVSFTANRLMRLTHKLTHNRKRAGGGNGAESTIASGFPEQKGPQSTGNRYSEGWQSVGKDEVSSSNLDSSSNY